ncbi:MAG: hypothetical protein GXY76_19485 [Chloroflexi bacterium]|nr:hypothetical protein [Chloroflexota bacterium]
MPERGNGHWNLTSLQGHLLGDLMGAMAELAPESRAEIWACDLGKPYVDRWLQMKGVPYSNPADGRDLAAWNAVTFFLGKQIELGFAQMLARCGVSHRAQERLRVPERKGLMVVLPRGAPRARAALLAIARRYHAAVDCRARGGSVRIAEAGSGVERYYRMRDRLAGGCR